MTTLIHQKFTAKQAIQALITGVEKALDGTTKEYENFQLDLGTYGCTDESSSICYGCAATVTLQELTDHVFTSETYDNESYHVYPEDGKHILNLHALSLNEDSADNYRFDDIARFEKAVDDFRYGSIVALYAYFNEPMPEIKPDWKMDDDNFGYELSKIKAFYNKLAA